MKLNLIILSSIIIVLFANLGVTQEESSLNHPTSKVDIDWVFVKGGTFETGRNDGDVAVKNVHTVTITDFYISKYEVTNEQFCQFLNERGNQKEAVTEWVDLNGNFSNEKCRIYKSGSNYQVEDGYEKHPVIYVSWYGAKEFCQWIGGRLPTEDEWEYAAKGGNKSKRYIYAGSNNPDEVAWHGDNSGDKTHQVGNKKANELSIYDMSGNVLEWCNNWYDADEDERVLRGGAWDYGDVFTRVTFRFRRSPNTRLNRIGFRVIR